MISSAELLRRYKDVSRKKDPNEMARFFKSIEPAPLPTALAIDKARAIQLSDGAEYSLDDAERLLRYVIDADSTAALAYLELGCLLDAVLDRSEEAIDVFGLGIEKAKVQLLDLIYEKAKTEIGLGHYSEASETLNIWPGDDHRFQTLRKEIEK